MTLKKYRKSHNKNKTYKKNKTHNKNRNIRKRTMKGGKVIPLNTLILDTPLMSPTWRANLNTLTTIHDPRNTPIELYGSSLPIDLFQCFRTFSYYMYLKEINRIISLQDCKNTVGHNRRKCPPLNENFEDLMWDLNKSIDTSNINNNNVQFININIDDMTSGTLCAWLQLNTYNYDAAGERTLVHCLAGFGRTGTVLLFALFKRIIQSGVLNINILSQQFLGCADSSTMYDFLMDMLTHAIGLDNQNNGQQIQGLINQFDTNRIIREVFNFSTTHKQSLLIARINNIIAMLALQLPDQTPLYLYNYKSHRINRHLRKSNIFVPMLVNFSMVDMYSPQAQGSYGFIGIAPLIPTPVIPAPAPVIPAPVIPPPPPPPVVIPAPVIPPPPPVIPPPPPPVIPAPVIPAPVAPPGGNPFSNLNNYGAVPGYGLVPGYGAPGSGGLI